MSSGTPPGPVLVNWPKSYCCAHWLGLGYITFAIGCSGSLQAGSADPAKYLLLCSLDPHRPCLKVTGNRCPRGHLQADSGESAGNLLLCSLNLAGYPLK